MNRPGRLLLAAALAVARAPDYAAFCLVIDPTTVEGFVTNNGPGILRVAGLIVYGVAGDPPLGRPMVQTQCSALIPSGATVSVGRARMPSALLPSETCRLDISAALR